MAIDLVYWLGVIVALIAIIEFLPKAIKWIKERLNPTPEETLEEVPEEMETTEESKPDIDIDLENCYYTVNDQPISTIHAELRVHNRGDQKTTIYEVELIDIVSDLLDDVYDPFFRTQVPVGPGETTRFRSVYSFPDTEIEGDIDLTLMIRHTYGQFSIACTAFMV